MKNKNHIIYYSLLKKIVLFLFIIALGSCQSQDYDQKIVDLKSFNLKTNIYFLSLEADCDCPTFSRDAGILEKGLFVQIAPGISYFQSKAEAASLVSEGNGTNFKLGLGLGVEIGLSDYLTITPIVKYNRYFNVDWEDLTNQMANISQQEVTFDYDKSTINQFYAGIRIGIKLRP